MRLMVTRQGPHSSTTLGWQAQKIRAEAAATKKTARQITEILVLIVSYSAQTLHFYRYCFSCRV